MPDPAPNALSHLDAEGGARMVDVGGKPITDRRAVAEGRVVVGPEVAAAIRANTLAKGDLLQVARLGGVQAAKRTADLVLMCHPLPLTHVDIEARLEGDVVVLRATTRAAGPTGVEMEALAAVTGAALNVIDMGKSLNPGMTIDAVRVVEKRGGKADLAKHGRWPDGLRVALLTVSDSRSAGQAEDLATPALAEAVRRLAGVELAGATLVADDHEVIVTQLRQAIAERPPIDLLLTTGGTGVASRDVTPEATAEVVQRPHPGLLELARARCLPAKPHAFLSRAAAGVADRTLIVNLPGSPRGAVETLEHMADVLPHTLKTLRGEADRHPTG